MDFKHESNAEITLLGKLRPNRYFPLSIIGTLKSSELFSVKLLSKQYTAGRHTTSSCDDPYADASYACGSPSCDAYASFRLA